jgi:hypothetical protein
MAPIGPAHKKNATTASSAGTPAEPSGQHGEPGRQAEERECEQRDTYGGIPIDRLDGGLPREGDESDRAPGIIGRSSGGWIVTALIGPAVLVSAASLPAHSSTQTHLMSSSRSRRG